MSHVSAKSFDRILVLAKPRLGDVLLATPLVRTLRRAYPESTLDVLVYDGQAEILEGNPDIDRTFTIAIHPTVAEYRQLQQRIFRRYDLAVSTSTSDRALIYLLAAGRTRLSVVPENKQAWKRKVTSGHVLSGDCTHTVIQNARLGDLLGLERCYEVVPPTMNDSGSKLDSLLPGVWRAGGYAVIHITPGMHYKRWTTAGWVEVGRFFQHLGLTVVLTGGTGEGERALVRSLHSRLGSQAVDLSGKLRLSEVADLLQKCRVYVGPDTVVTHLAAAVGAPTLALFGPTNPAKWGPWPRGYAQSVPPFPLIGSRRVGNVLLLQGRGPCVPCEQEGCERHRYSRSDCLDQLDHGKAIAALAHLMATKGERRTTPAGDDGGVTLTVPLSTQRISVPPQNSRG